MIKYKHISTLDDELIKNIFEMTKSLEQFYPEYKKWFNVTLMAGIRKGHRSVVVVTVDDKTVACSVLKNTVQEKKICSVYVLPTYRRRGIGEMLIDYSMCILNDANIKITIPEENNPWAIKHLKNKGFLLQDVRQDMYRTGVSEYHYASGYIRKPKYSYLKPCYGYKFITKPKQIVLKRTPAARHDKNEYWDKRLDILENDLQRCVAEIADNKVKTESVLQYMLGQIAGAALLAYIIAAIVSSVG